MSGTQQPGSPATSAVQFLVARLLAGADVAVRAAARAVQLRGDLDMTWENPTRLRLKRAKADQVLLGAPMWRHTRLTKLVDLPARGERSSCWT